MSFWNCVALRDWMMTTWHVSSMDETTRPILFHVACYGVIEIYVINCHTYIEDFLKDKE